MIEQFGALVVEVGAADEFERVVQAKVLLGAFLDLVRLAQDLIGVYAQLRVACPLAVADVLVVGVPGSPIVASVERLDMALFGEAFTITATRPDEVVRLSGMEMEDIEAENVGWDLRAQRVPCSASVGSVEISFSCCDEVCPIKAVFVMVERDEFLVGEEMIPSVPLVRGLPY